MSTLVKRALRIMLVAGCVLFSTRLAEAGPAYTVTVLGGNGLGGIETATGLNAWGQVTGYNLSGVTQHALLWTPAMPNAPAGSIHDIQLDPGFPAGAIESRATALNNRGEVVGIAYVQLGFSEELVSWLWRPVPLNSPAGTLNGAQGHAVKFPNIKVPGLGAIAETPHAINDFGRIAGAAIYDHLVVFTPTLENGMLGTWTAEPAYPSEPSGINNGEQIAGGTSEAKFDYPYLHHGLPPLSPADFIDSAMWDHTPYKDLRRASAINAAGHVAINATEKTSRQSRAYLYENGHVIDVSGGGKMTYSNGINRFDTIVGTGAGVAYLASAGVTIDINTLIPAAPAPATWLMNDAVAINDTGQIICQGTYFVGSVSRDAAFLLTPAATGATRQTRISSGAIRSSAAGSGSRRLRQ